IKVFHQPILDSFLLSDLKKILPQTFTLFHIKIINEPCAVLAHICNQLIICLAKEKHHFLTCCEQVFVGLQVNPFVCSDFFKRSRSEQPANHCGAFALLIKSHDEYEIATLLQYEIEFT